MRVKPVRLRMYIESNTLKKRVKKTQATPVLYFAYVGVAYSPARGKFISGKQ